MDLSKLTTSDKIIAASGIVLFIASFLTWFSAESEVSGAEDLGIDLDSFTESVSVNGWDVGFFWAGLPALIGLAAVAVVLLPKLSDVKLPALPIPWNQAILGAAALAALLVILKLLIGVDGPSSGSASFGEVEVSYEVNRGIGIFLATLAAIGLAVGAWLRYQANEGDESTAMDGGTGNAPF